MEDPEAASKPDRSNPTRNLLEAIMRVSEQLPSITGTEAWEHREQDMRGRNAHDVISQWVGILNSNLDEVQIHYRVLPLPPFAERFPRHRSNDAIVVHVSSATRNRRITECSQHLV